jgi:hypothetical protein
MLSQDQHAEFGEWGLLRLPKALPTFDAQRMVDLVWSQLAAEHGIHREAPQTWTIERPIGFKPILGTDVFRRLPAPVHAATDDLVEGLDVDIATIRAEDRAAAEAEPDTPPAAQHDVAEKNTEQAAGTREQLIGPDALDETIEDARKASPESDPVWRLGQAMLDDIQRQQARVVEQTRIEQLNRWHADDHAEHAATTQQADQAMAADVATPVDR